MILGGDPVRYALRADLDPRVSVSAGEFPSHGHGPGERWVLGEEVHGLYDPSGRYEIEEAYVDDVGVRGRLAWRVRGIRVGEDEPVGASRARIEVLEPAAHPSRR